MNVKRNGFLKTKIQVLYLGHYWVNLIQAQAENAG